MKAGRCVTITDEAYAVLVRMADEEEGRVGHFVAIGRVASRLILERAGLPADEPALTGRNLRRAKRYLKTLIAGSILSGCALATSPDAEADCHAIFEAWSEAAQGCQLEATMPDPNQICSHAYAVDEGNLDGCLGWIRSGACDEFDNEHFQAHCGHVISLRTW